MNQGGTTRRRRGRRRRRRRGGCGRGNGSQQQRSGDDKGCIKCAVCETTCWSSKQYSNKQRKTVKGTHTKCKHATHQFAARWPPRGPRVLPRHRWPSPHQWHSCWPDLGSRKQPHPCHEGKKKEAGDQKQFARAMVRCCLSRERERERGRRRGRGRRGKEGKEGKRREKGKARVS